MALVITLHLTGDMFCCSKVAKGRGFLLPFVFHDDWQSLCLFIDLWLLSKSWLFSSCVYVLLWKLGVIIPGLVGSQNDEIEFISCDCTFFGILCLYPSTHFSQSVVITLSDSGQTLSHCSRLRFQVWKKATICSWQFDSISMCDQNLSVCVSSFFFVRFITSLLRFSWSRTALWWSSAAPNMMLFESVDVEHEIGQETSVLF